MTLTLTRIPSHRRLVGHILVAPRAHRPGGWIPTVFLLALGAAACESPEAPASCGSIPQVSIHTGETSVVEACFNDANGDLLSYTATSSSPGVATVGVSGASITVRAVSPGSGWVTITASDPGGLQGQQSFEVVVPNRAPKAVGTIPSTTISVGQSETVDVSSYFEEPDGSALTYGAMSSNGQSALASVAGSTVTVTAVAKGVVTVTVTARDPEGLTATQAFVVTVPNRAPEPVGTIPDIEALEVGGEARVGVAAYFTDPDRDALTYTATSSSPSKLRVSVSGTVLTVTAVAKGVVMVTVTARDPEGLTATQAFVATVPNRAPVAGDPILDMEVEMDAIASVDVAEHFSDPDGDLLAYMARSSSPAHATVTVSGGVVMVRGVRVGAATVTVTASDPEGLTARQTFAVEVLNPDRRVLGVLYSALGGDNWITDTNWGTDAPLDEWHGVTTSETGRVVRLELRANGLAGEIPVEAGRLRFLERLDLARNRVDDEISSEVGGDEPRPREDADGLFAGAWPSPLADGIRAPERRGRSSTAARSAGITGPIPRELANLSNLKELWLADNSLSGAIPPELGNLLRLETLWLADNSLSGAIPPELGDLSRLRSLYLHVNDLTGTIPRELGELSNLRSLSLETNSLTGAIPRELGELSNLEELWSAFSGNLTGPIPRELGNLSRLRILSLPGNSLTGAIPRELGELPNLGSLWLYDNSLTGAIPSNFVGLSLTDFWWSSNTDLCAPAAEEFQDWLRSIKNHRGGRTCPAAISPAAYLVQSVQSRSDPVPVVTDKAALLRVFVTATRTTTESLPPATATFFVDGSETYAVDIDGKSATIPTDIIEGSLDRSLNVTIPDSVIEEGLSVVIDIDPDSTIEAGILVARRIPKSGELDLGVENLPAFELTAIPFLYTEDPDSSVLDVVEEMESDEEDHELLHDTYDLLPIEEMSVDAHDPVEIDSRSGFAVLRRTFAIRAAESGSGYWMGLMPEFSDVGGVAYISGTSSASVLNSRIIAHELGHNISLLHAPCGRPAGVDPDYPYDDGSIGAWGYDHRGDSLINADTWDLMTYCWPGWVSDYHFEKAAEYRIAQALKYGATSGRTGPSLLVWGTRSPSGELSMDPALVVEGRSLLPEAPGDYALTGLDGAERELFSISFDMEEPADAEEGTGMFVFLFPAQPGWEELASLVLTGPGEALFTLDGDTDATMAWVRDARSGQVRAIRGDFDERPRVPPGHVVRWSRGIPDRDAWRLR